MHDPLFERAKPEILYLNGDLPRASDDFIPQIEEEKFEEDLKSASAKRYCKYLLYKIVHFLEIISFVQVQTMVGDFMRDNYGLYWLLNLSKVQYTGFAGSVRGSQVQFKEKDIEVESPAKPQKHDNEKNEAVKEINDIMQQHYVSIVKKLGVEHLTNIEHEDTASDEVFAKIYPGSQMKLSQLVKGNRKYSEIQEFVIKNQSILRGTPTPRTETTKQSHKRLNHSDIVHMTSDASFEFADSRKNTISKPDSSQSNLRRTRPTSAMGHRHHRPVTPPRVMVPNPSISQMSQNPQKPQKKNYFRAVKYQNGRRDEYSDNPNQYLG